MMLALRLWQRSHTISHSHVHKNAPTQFVQSHAHSVFFSGKIMRMWEEEIERWRERIRLNYTHIFFFSCNSNMIYMMHRMTVACACLHVHFSYSSAHLHLIFTAEKTSVIKDLPISKPIIAEVYVELIYLWHFLNVWIFTFLLLFFLLFFCVQKPIFLVFVVSSVVKREKWDIFRLLTTNP